MCPTAAVDFVEVAALPRLAWCARLDCRAGTLSVVHGAGVETRGNGFVEGAWAGDFGGDDFDVAFMTGTGAKRRHDGWRFVTPTHTLDRLNVLRKDDVLYWTRSWRAWHGTPQIRGVKSATFPCPPFRAGYDSPAAMVVATKVGYTEALTSRESRASARGVGTRLGIALDGGWDCRRIHRKAPRAAATSADSKTMRVGSPRLTAHRLNRPFDTVF